MTWPWRRISKAHTSNDGNIQFRNEKLHEFQQAVPVYQNFGQGMGVSLYHENMRTNHAMSMIDNA